jgi:hypothetical protein
MSKISESGVEKQEDVILQEDHVIVDGQENVVVDGHEIGHVDEAGTFLAEHKDVDTSHIDIKKLRHRVDRNVVSILCLLFILAFLDKAIYNYTGM